jgi:hypothetical protein
MVLKNSLPVRKYKFKNSISIFSKSVEDRIVTFSGKMDLEI